MQFLKGLLVGILGFILWVIASIIGGIVIVGERLSGNTDDTLTLLYEKNPLITLFLLVGFLLMFFAPLYYWIIQPIFRPSKNKYLLPLPSNQLSNLPLRNSHYYYKVPPQGNTSIYNIHIDELKRLLNCPNDNARLQQYIDKSAQNSFFIVTKSNIHAGIQNAISMRKIPMQASYQTEQIINYLFSNTNAPEITLVSTICPQCHIIVTVPKF